MISHYSIKKWFINTMFNLNVVKRSDFAWGSITIRPRWEKQIILNTEDFVGGIFYKSI